MTGTTTLGIGQRVCAVEHNESARTPRPGGKSYPAVVVAVGPVYTLVRYDNQVLNSGKDDQFYTESGWRAWDGCMRWRLEPEGSRP